MNYFLEMSVINGQVESSDIDLKIIQIDIGNKIKSNVKQINIFCINLKII